MDRSKSRKPAPLWKKAVAFGLRAFTYTCLVVICFEISVWIHPPMLALGLDVIGRNVICSPAEALLGAQLHARVFYDGEALVAHSRILESDGRFNRWQTPRGDWWVPKGSDAPVLGFLAQQQNKIYGEGPWGVQKGDIVLDAGANIGVYTREALDEGASLVVAIEPGPENVECLRRNFKSGVDAGRVVVAALGVW